MEADHLPEAIVAPVGELRRALCAWAGAHPDPTKAELEAAVLIAWRTASRTRPRAGAASSATHPSDAAASPSRLVLLLIATFT
jgi:hypothetical protein